MVLRRSIRIFGVLLAALLVAVFWVLVVRAGSPTSRVQHVNNGISAIPVVSHPADQHQPVMTTDGAGGAIIAWTDTRVPPTGTVPIWFEDETVIYAQRVASGGHPLWGLDGLPVVDLARPISQVFYLHSQPAVVADGAGGALIGFLNEAGNPPGVYVQRIDGYGDMVWRDRYRYGHEIANMDENLMDILVMASDGAEGAILVWGLYTDKGGRLYAQRVGRDGDKLWEKSVPLFTNFQSDTAFDPRIVPDGFGGAIIVWRDYRAGLTAGVFAQRLNKDGNKLWGQDGVPVASSASDDPLFKPQVGIAADGLGGAYVTWDAKLAAQTKVYAQYLDEDGAHRWPASLLLSDHTEPGTTANSSTPVITLDGSGGVYVAWQRQYPVSVRAHRVDSAGTLLWGDLHTGGLDLSPTSSYLSAENISIVPDGGGGAFVAWECISTAGMAVHQNMCVQGFDRDGGILCGPSAVELATILKTPTDLALVPGEAQRLIASWKDLPDPSFEDRHDIFAQSADAACVGLWQIEPDVMLRDNERDSGVVPSSTPWWDSPDIWVRNSDDFIEEHQNPLADQQNTVYVRVKNRGNTTANDVELHAYQRPPDLGVIWPGGWTEIISTSLSTLDPGASQVVALPWTPETAGPAGLLVRVAAAEDPVTVEGDVPGDNNIAHKNVDIIHLAADQQVIPSSGWLESAGESASADSVFLLTNPQTETVAADVVIELDALAPGGELSVDLGTQLFDRWEAAGAELHGAEIETGSTRISVTSPISASIIGLSLEASESLPLTATITAPSTDMNWLYINIWERIAGGAVGGFILRAPRNYNLAGSTKSASILEIMQGDVVTYTLTLTNAGNLDHPAVAVTDTLPLSMTYLSDSLAWSAGQGTYADGTVSWTGPVSLTQLTTITYRARVDALAPAEESITNTVSIDDGLNPLIERWAAVGVLEAPKFHLYQPLLFKGQ